MNRIVAAALCALLLAGCGGSGGTPRSAAVFAPGATVSERAADARFAAELDSLRQELRIPGLAAAVVRDGGVAWAQGFGFANLAWRVRATPHTPFHLASLTKPVAATAIMQLVDKGAVGLWDPLTKWGIRLGGPGSPQVWNLLSHTSGGDPGGGFEYDGNRYALLERIIGRATGQSFDERLRTSILKPLGMSETAPNDSPSWDTFLLSLGIGERRGYARSYARLARPYRVTPRFTVVNGSYPLELSTSAGIVSSVLDLAKLDAALDGGKLMRAETRELMWRPMAAVSGEDGSLFYGLGWFVQYAYGMRLVWHYGIWPPSVSALWLKVPDAHLSLILLANTDGLSAPFPLGEGDVLTSAFALAFARSFVYPRLTGQELPAVDWKAPEADLTGRLARVADPVARDLLERELWSRRQVFANTGRWDLANRLFRVRRAAFPESEREAVQRFVGTYGGAADPLPPSIGLWEMVWGGRAAALWALITLASLVLLVSGLASRYAARRYAGRAVAWPGWLPSVAVFGPLGLVGHLVAERRAGRAGRRAPRTPSAPLGVAVARSLDDSARYALALWATLAALSGRSPIPPAAAAAVSFAAALLAGVFLRAPGRGYLRAVRAAAVPELLRVAVAAAAAFPLVSLLQARWFPLGADVSSPFYWLAVPPAAAAACAILVPLELLIEARSRR